METRTDRANGSPAVMAEPAPHVSSADEDLVQLAAGGDPDAFAALYDRHFSGVYDFAARIVRDRDLAGDVVQSVFARTWSRLRAGGEVSSVRAFLYAAARNEAIDELRRRHRLVPAGDEESGPLFAVADATPGADPERAVLDKELAELVWSAARGLNEQEYALLDMNVRRGLGAEEMASALGLKVGAVYTRLTRLRDAFEASVTTLILMRRGRRDCQQLDTLLTSLDAGPEPTPAIRKAVQKHVKDCAVCETGRGRYASAAAIFGALAPVPALPGMQAAIRSALLAGPRAAGHAGGRRPRGTRRSLRRGMTLPVLAGALLVAVAITAISIAGNGGSSGGGFRSFHACGFRFPASNFFGSPVKAFRNEECHLAPRSFSWVADTWSITWAAAPYVTAYPYRYDISGKRPENIAINFATQSCNPCFIEGRRHPDPLRLWAAFPEQHVKAVRVTFDRGGTVNAQLQDIPDWSAPIPAGATAVTHIQVLMEPVRDGLPEIALNW